MYKYIVTALSLLSVMSQTSVKVKFMTGILTAFQNQCFLFLTHTKTNDCIKHQQFENVIQRDSLSNDRLYRSNSFNKLTSMSKKYYEFHQEPLKMKI